MADPDDVLVRVADAAEAGRRGDRELALALFHELWDQLGEDGDPLHRCAVAHGLADVQDDVRQELVWDLRALEAVRKVTEARAAQAGMGPPAGMLPSLHLNLGDAYLRVGDHASARHHLGEGLAAVHRLPEDGYGVMVRSGLERLAARLADGPAGSDAGTAAASS